MTGTDSIISKDTLPGTQTIQCPGCNNTIKYFVPGQSIQIGCSHCKNLFKFHKDRLAKIKGFKTSISPIIPLGTICTFEDIKYKLVGFLYCKEHKYQYYWKEYIFFNPLYGYLTLNEYDGHWNKIVQTDYYPRHAGRSAVVQQKEYQIFHKYRSQVVYAIGEFHWNLNESFHPYCTEYIHPPYSLIEEKREDEISWYHATYIQPAKVKEILGVNNLPKKVGISSNQPITYGFSNKGYKVIRNISIVLLIVTQMLFMLSSSGKRVLHMEYTFPNDYQGTTVVPIISESFDVHGGLLNTVNLEFEIFSPVENTWVAANITLINDSTGQVYSFEHGVEYYFGNSAEGSWTEGSQYDSKIISKIPAGRYHLNVIPFKESNIVNASSHFTIAIFEDVIVWTNFFATLAGLLIFPLILYFRNQSFESRRWLNSEYSE